MKDPKNRLIQAVCSLLENGLTPENLTTRTIAEEAGLAHGLINYHFGSKDRLLAESIEYLVDQSSLTLPQNDYQVSSLRERILTLLMTYLQLGFQNRPLLAFRVKQDLNQAGLTLIKKLLPILREYLGDQKREEELFILASQLVQPLQLYFLHPETLEMELGWELKDPRDAELFLETLIKNAGIGGSL